MLADALPAQEASLLRDVKGVGAKLNRYPTEVKAATADERKQHTQLAERIRKTCDRLLEHTRSELDTLGNSVSSLLQQQRSVESSRAGNEKQVDDSGDTRRVDDW